MPPYIHQRELHIVPSAPPGSHTQPAHPRPHRRTSALQLQLLPLRAFLCRPRTREETASGFTGDHQSSGRERNRPECRPQDRPSSTLPLAINARMLCCCSAAMWTRRCACGRVAMPPPGRPCWAALGSLLALLMALLQPCAEARLPPFDERKPSNGKSSAVAGHQPSDDGCAVYLRDGRQNPMTCAPAVGQACVGVLTRPVPHACPVSKQPLATSCAPCPPLPCVPVAGGSLVAASFATGISCVAIGVLVWWLIVKRRLRAAAYMVSRGRGHLRVRRSCCCGRAMPCGSSPSQTPVPGGACTCTCTCPVCRNWRSAVKWTGMRMRRAACQIAPRLGTGQPFGCRACCGERPAR